MIPDTGALERVATGFVFTEGPVWSSRGGFLLFSDIPANTIHRWDGGAPRVWRHPSNWSNGLAYDAEGRLLACEHVTSRITRTERDGTIVPVATHYQCKELNSPNDLVVKRDGAVYFTDPLSGRTARMGRERDPELPFCGVYRVVPGEEPTLLASDFAFPNGLCFSPDEARLYVNDTAAPHVRVFDVRPDGSISGGRLFLDQSGTAHATGKPDGMKVDEHGNLYATGPGGVWVVRPDGDVLGIVEVPEVAHNLAWGGNGRSVLFVAAGTSLYTLPTAVRGAGLPGAG